MNWKKKVFENFRLYAVTDLCGDDPGIFEKVETVYRGGADIVQLRSKHLSDAVLYRIGTRCRKIADRLRKLFFVNDRLDLALAVEADGVHLGQEDLPMEAVRKICAPARLLVGRSTHNLKQALDAVREGVDYIGVGPVFKTPTKQHYRPVGTRLIHEVAGRVRIPFVAIGGINSSNIGEVLSAGARRVAVVRAVFGSSDPCAAARELCEAMEAYEK